LELSLLASIALILYLHLYHPSLPSSETAALHKANQATTVYGGIYAFTSIGPDWFWPFIQIHDRHNTGGGGRVSVEFLKQFSASLRDGNPNAQLRKNAAGKPHCW